VEKVRVGLIGCGMVAFGHYLPGIANMPKAEFVAVCDRVEERAMEAAANYSIPQVYTDLDEMLVRSGVELVVNTTHIQLHDEVNLKILQENKHLYSEKSLSTSVGGATKLIEEAKKRSLKLGAAAATMLTPAVQKIAELLGNGAIGKPCFTIAHHSHPGVERLLNVQWSTDPTWFYKHGAGPLLDMGVYGLHTMTGLFGPAKAVSAMAGRSMPQRVVRTGTYKGDVIDVEVPDMVLVTLDFGDDVLGFEDCGWCVRAAKGPLMQVFGTNGVIVVNGRDEPHPLSIWRDDEAHNIYGWMGIDLAEKPRSPLAIGVEHLIECILDPGKPIITSGEHARHVIEIMAKASVAAAEGRTMKLETTFP